MKGVIFDLDGVILDSMPSHVSAWQQACAETGLVMARSFFYRNEGMMDRERLCLIADESGQSLEPDRFDDILVRQRQIYGQQYADRVSLFPQAADLLNRLAGNGLRLALVTSSPRRIILSDLWQWLEARFHWIVTGDQVRRTKPAPDPYLEALHGLDLGPRAALAVENAPAGIESAKTAGLRCLALATTLSRMELSEADWILDNHDDLAEWFARRMADDNSGQASP